MHGGPDGVGPQAQEQFEYPPVGLGADLPLRSLLIIHITPRARAPVLIVDEDAPAGHAGGMIHCEVVVDDEAVAPLRHDVAPPYPRRDARQTGEFEDAVGRAPAVMPLDDNLPATDGEAEAVVGAPALHDPDGRPVGIHRRQPRHLPHVVLPHRESRSDHGVSTLSQTVGDGMLPVETHHARGAAHCPAQDHNKE